MDVSSDDIPEKAMYLLLIADAHYFFKDYPKAVSYYTKILEEENSNNQTTIQHALNGLGLCYRNGYRNYETSNYYFRSMMNVNYPNDVKELYPEVFNGIAEGNLGHNLLFCEEYEQAIPLLTRSFETLSKHRDYAYASGPAINLADIYLKKGNLQEAKKYTDIAIAYNKIMPREGRQARIYEVLSKYYAATGNTKLSMAYMDSTLQANKEYEEQFNAMLLLRMEQKEFAQQQQELVKEKKEKKQIQTRLMLISAGFVVISLLLVSLLYLYRKKRRAYLGLYRQIKEQDRLEEELKTMPGTKQQRLLVASFREFLLKDNYYATFDIDIQELISKTSSNRAYFFKALKTVTGKTPMEFINHLRLDEAKRLLDNTNLTIETIALECGFNTVRTFYRQFRDRYQITPAEYRNIALVISD
jgi:AraC-like DNA-binding protein